MIVTQDDFNKLNKQEMDEVFEKVKQIEASAYPKFMQSLQYLKSVEDAMNYVECDGKILFHLGTDWYMLGCQTGNEVEIADLASKKGIPPFQLNQIFEDLKKSFSDKIITCDARSSTSYKLIKYLEKSGDIEIIHEEPWNWGPEKMHELKFTFKKNNDVKESHFRSWYSTRRLLEVFSKDESFGFCLKRHHGKDE